MTKPLIAPSLMCMDLMNVERDIKVMDEAFDWYHIDVMDSHFCPNMALNPAFTNQVRKISKLPIDVHLMVENPIMFVDMFELAETDCLSFQAETIERNAFRLYQSVKKKGLKFGVVLSPATPLCAIEAYAKRIDILTIMTVDTGFAGQTFIDEMLEKIEAAARLREDLGAHYLIQLDGQTNTSTYKKMANCAADIFIVGSSGLFSQAPELSDAIAIFKQQFSEGTGKQI